MKCSAKIFLAIALLFAQAIYAADYDYIELNPYTGNLDATRSDSSLEEVISHSDLDDMDATVHDTRYLNLSNESTDVTGGIFDLTTTGTLSAGNVGIGTTDPDEALHIKDGDFLTSGPTPRHTFHDTGTDKIYSWHGGDATELSEYNNFACLRHDVGGRNIALMNFDDDDNIFLGYNPPSVPVLGVDVVNRRVGIGTASPAQSLTIASPNGEESISIYHDNNNVRITPTTDTANFQTSKADTKSVWIVQGRGTGSGRGQFRSGNSAALWFMEAANSGSCDLDVGIGTAFYLLRDAVAPIYTFFGSTSGETQPFRLYGYRTGDAKRYLQMEVGEDADDSVSFSGLSNYLFDGNVGIGTTNPTGLLHVGDQATNYLQVEADGTIEFVGSATVFDDLRTPVNAVKVPATKAPTWTAYNGTQLLGFSYQAVEGNEEEIYFTIQLTHGYKEGSDIVPHIHWVPNEDTTDDPEVVRWGLEYEWQNIGGTFAGSTTIWADESMTDESDDHIKTLFAAIDGTGKTISSMLTCRLFRNSSHENDTYDSGTALALFMEIDFHFEKDTVGSRLIDDAK